jgi:hypothetical protein
MGLRLGDLFAFVPKILLFLPEISCLVYPFRIRLLEIMELPYFDMLVLLTNICFS